MQYFQPDFRLNRALRAALVLTVTVCALVQSVRAQPQISQSSTLPLRNLQIEVRQVQSGQRENASAGVQGGAQLTGNGQIGLNGQGQIQQRSQTQSGSSNQFALVLNGRSTRIALGSTVPLRVYQTYVRNGQRILAEGNVLLEANTGFSATPRWTGADTVELEVAAQQTLSNSSQGGLNPNANIGSVLVLPLNEWSTIASSEQSDNTQDRSLLGTGSSARQTAVEVQVRVTVR